MAIQNPYGTPVTPRHGQYYFAARNGASLGGGSFAGGNQAVVATALAAGLPTTYTGGLILYNPVASTVNLVINQVGLSFILAQTNASTIGLGVGRSATAPTGTLTVVPSTQNMVGTSTTAKGILYSSASVTLPVAPYLARVLTTVYTGALTTALSAGQEPFDIGGGVILTPGAFACITSTAAGTASSFLGSFVWEEVLTTSAT